ncbi:Protein FAR-RED IMPAIRED RESPONSE 1 [Bienertia sinuspersici]
MVFSSYQEVETYYKAYANQQGFGMVRAAWSDSHTEEDSGVKTSKKCECLVQIYASVNAENENKLVVRKVVNEHQNHNPTPSKSRFIAAHCKEERNCHVKRKMKLGHSVGKKKLKLKDGDAKAMLEYFEKMTEGNQILSHTYRLENFGQLQDILWVDACSRAMYEEFNDVVCFDTTYLTYQYKLPFANLVGVNHHGQTNLLRRALISHETTETFE